MVKSKGVRSSHAKPEDLVVACELETCEDRFLTFMGMRTHLWRKHGITRKGLKIEEGATQCTNCLKEFEDTISLRAHGGPKACQKRTEKGHWDVFSCRYKPCGKQYKKYAGPNSKRKGLIYCSTDCSVKARTLFKGGI